MALEVAVASLETVNQAGLLPLGPFVSEWTSQDQISTHWPAISMSTKASSSSRQRVKVLGLMFENHEVSAGVLPAALISYVSVVAGVD